MKKLILLVFLSIAFTQTYAIDGIIIKTTDYSFSEKWNNNLSIPKLITSDTVFIGQNIFITAIAGDYELNSDNQSIVEYSLKIIKPDNTIYFSQEKLPIINSVLPDNKNLYMSEAILKMSFEENDLLGKYKIEIVVKDIVSGKSKKINSSLFVTKLPIEKKHVVENMNEFSNWFSHYYENPKPETALDYFIFYSNSKLAEDDSRFYTMFSIFLEIFKNNKFLLPQIVDTYKQQEGKTQFFLIHLMYYSNIGAEEFLDGLEGNEKQYYLQLKASEYPDLYGEITNPSQLDMLWATFLAGGSYKPIHKLITTLDYVKYSNELEKYKNSKNKTAENRVKAVKNTVYTSLVWSIKSNCKQHNLVKGYAKWALKYGDLNDIQKVELEKILNDI